MSRPSRPLVLACLGVVLLGCPADESASATRKGDAKTKVAKVEVKRDAKGDAKTDAKTDAKADAPKNGRVLDGPLPIADMLGHTPAEVEAKLGDTLGKGSSRTSCVRYVPDRTWFKCAHARQRYADPNGKFTAIGMEFEDGKASAIAFDGFVAAEGAFTPEAALAIVGLELPGEPKVDEPEPGTKVWSWWNSSARLLVNGRQHRVQVSSVGDDWTRTKVEIVLNDPLSADELARKVEPGAAEQPG
jgi:hypothetical protein